MDRQALHFGNIARSKGESVRPDLWADHCWCPLLGIQGDTVFDICGGKHGTKINSSWVTGAKGTQIYFDGDGDYVSTSIVVPSEFTILLSGTHVAGVLSMCAGFGDTTSSSNFTMVHTQTNDKPRGFIYTGTFNGCEAANTISAGDVSIAFTATTAQRNIYVNGKLDGTDTDADVFPTVGTFYIGKYAWVNTPIYATGATYTVSLYKSILNVSQILDLTTDPLLPLRRKKQWSMYVPSTGGVFKPYWCQTPTTIGAA